MRVAHLSLGDFRNYQTAELPLHPGANLLVGRNGQGKTNLVEAIAYFATLRSHRVSNDAAMIRADRNAAIMRMRIIAGGSGGEREVMLETQLNRSGRNVARVNGNAGRSRELTRWFAAVIFAPEDLAIVRGEPAVRRRFLDDALITRLPVAAGAISDYERIVRQRTSLLKSARASSTHRAALDATLAVWDEQLIEHGVRIMLARRELVRDLAGPLSEAYAALVGSDHGPSLALAESVREVVSENVGVDRVSRETSELDLAAGGSVSRETSLARLTSDAKVSRETLAEEFRTALAAVRAREIERGVTLVGPHRDDLVLRLNGLPVKGYASHGESWSFALGLKIGLANVLRAESPAGDPVIILDDVFAELDRGRRERLMSLVGDFEQVIVTAAVEEDVPDGLSWHRAVIDAGTVRSQGESEGGSNAAKDGGSSAANDEVGA